MPEYEDKIRAMKRRQRKIKDKRKRTEKPEERVHEEYYRMKINPRDIELIMEYDYDGN